ncbi:MAG: hypothetical protein NVS1B11_05000 [Terriglobales bacterium]
MYLIHIQHPRVSRPPSNTRSESGYILLTLILFVALLAIAAAAIAPAIVFQAKRDREEELIHRGVQYSRAVRAYYKKFGRYPTKVEELESTNNLRFLRKRFKDPVTGQDFKLLHQQDVQFAFGPGIAGAIGAAGTGAAASLQKLGGQAGLLAAAAQVQNASPNTGLNQPADNSSAGASGESPQSPNQPNFGQSNFGQSNLAASNSSTSGPGTANVSGSGSGNPVFGGGPIVGVVSTSKTKSIRVFNKKDHYNQWQFIYDPSTDRGGLLNTPNQPPLQNAVAPTPANGQPGAPGGPNALGAPNTPGGTTSRPLSPGLQDQPPDDKQ